MSFPGFTNQFTTSPISTAFPQYLSLSVGSTGLNPSPVQLYWPFQAPYQANQFAQVIQVVYNDDTTNAIILPDATATSTGQSSFIVNNTANAINLYQYGTTTPVSGTPLAAGTSYQLILTSNANQTGWKAIVFGESVPTPATSLIDLGTQDVFAPGISLPVNGSAPDLTYPLTGGLTVEDDQFSSARGPNYLKTYMHVNTYNNVSDAYQQTQGDRGTLLVWDTGATLAYDLMPVVDVIPDNGNGANDGFVFSINNSNTTSGNCLITPAGSDTLEGIYNSGNPFVLLPGQSLTLVSDGIGNWATLGYGLNTVPTNLNNVIVKLQSGTALAPSLSFSLDTSVSPANSLGAFYQTISPGIGVVPGWAASLRGSWEFVQNNGFTPTIMADFQANPTWPNGLVTLAWQGKSQVSGSTFTPSLVSLITNYTFSSTTATLWSGSTFTSTTASFFGSTFTASIATLFGSTFTTAAISLNATGNIGLTSSTGDISLTSSAGDVDILATDNIQIVSTTGYLDLTCDVEMTLTAVDAVNNVTPLIQQYGISIYSLARAYL